MIFGIVLDALIVLIAVIGLIVGLKNGITHTFLVKHRKLTAMILGAICAKPLARFITERFLLSPFARFVMKTADLTEIEGATSAEALLDKVPLVIRFVAERLGYDLKATAEVAFAEGEGMYFTVIRDLSYPLVNAISLLLCSILFFFFMRLILRIFAGMAEDIVELPLLKQVNTLLGGVFGLFATLAILWVASKVLVFVLSFEKVAALGFLQDFDIAKTYVFRYVWGFEPLSFILSIQ